MSKPKQQETAHKTPSQPGASATEPPDKGPVVGLALGSGSARGWAHIGVIRALEKMGVRPQVVAGTSIGSLVGAAYALGQLDDFEKWVRKLTSRDVMGLMDFTLSGGFVKGERLFGVIESQHSNPEIEALPLRYACVATAMRSGREVWLSKGGVLDAVRASCAMPGVMAPVQVQGEWMLDGGLVNPVPISVCRALGADVVIAVNLNAQLIGVPLQRATRKEAEAAASAEEVTLWDRLAGYFSSGDDEAPGLFDVMGASINIMQDRITRARMAGDPAEVTLVPLLENYGLMDFHRGAEAIAEGEAVVQRREVEIQRWTQAGTAA